MTTPDLERRLADLLRDRAEGAMKDTNTQDKLTSVLTDGERRLQNRRRGVVAGLVAAAAAVAVVVAVETGRGDNEGTAPASAPDVHEVAVAENLLEAMYAFDLDAAEAQLSSDVTIAGDEAGTRSSVEQWLAELAWVEAIGTSLADHTCATTLTSAAGTVVRCMYAINAFGSEERGQGLYEDNVLDVTIVDGQITKIEDYWPFETNGFDSESWRPFQRWIVQEHPRDVEAMYTDSSFTMPMMDARSLQLWEQRVGEWVASGCPDSLQPPCTSGSSRQ